MHAAVEPDWRGSALRRVSVSLTRESEAPLADLGDAGEVLTYVVGFWAFLFSPKYRARTLHAWRHADRARRAWMVLDGAVATLIGLGLPLLVAGIVASELLAR